jgi:putative acetyltransferase
MSEIVIRHIEARDAEALRDIMSHPGVYHDTLQLPHPSMDMWHDRVATKPGRRHLVACLDQRVVGHMALDVMENPRRSHVATFGISVAAEALALYKKFGFEIEGTGRNFALRNGDYVDAYYMARLK